MTQQSKNRFFTVEYMKAGGGQVFSTLVEFYHLTEVGKKLASEGNAVLSCKERKDLQ